MENFQFNMPAILEKSDDGEYRVKGLASTEDIDLQGEIIKAAGADLSPIDEKKGWLNFEHRQGVEDLVGVLEGYNKTPNGIFVSGRMFKDHDRAKAIIQVMQGLSEKDGPRIGLSVEGSVLERDPNNEKVITKCIIKNVAITMSPVNPKTHLSLVKSLAASNVEFSSTLPVANNIEKVNATETPIFTANQVVDLIQKTLGVGGGYATQTPAQMSGGTALSQESLDSKPSDVSSSEEEKKKKKEQEETQKALQRMPKSLYKATLQEILSKIGTLYPEYTKEQLFACMKERLETKFPDLK
jgi:hypothetical protein